MILYDQESERDCLKACIQTILQRPDVPSFWVPGGTALDQDRKIREYLKSIRYSMCTFYFPSNMDILFDFDHLAISWGIGPRHKEIEHAVVVQPYESQIYLHHDPHPSRAGVEEFKGLMLIYPKD